MNNIPEIIFQHKHGPFKRKISMVVLVFVGLALLGIMFSTNSFNGVLYGPITFGRVTAVLSLLMAWWLHKGVI